MFLGMSSAVAGFDRRQLDKFARDFGLTVKFISEDQMRLWGEDMIRRTPPLGSGAKINKAVGDAAVAKDFAKIFQAIDQPAVFQTFAKAQSDGDVWRIGKNGRRYRIKPESRGATMPRIENWHKRHRSKKTGRTFAPRFSPNDAWDGRMVVLRPYILKYLKQRQKHVGTLAAGWLPATEYYARRVGKQAKAPGFVKKQARRMGFHVDAMSDTGRGYLQGSTTVPWARKAKLHAVISMTQNTRRRDMQQHILRRMKRMIVQFNSLKATA